MSMHKIPLLKIERTGLQNHGLVIGKPSQLSDAFRQGVRHALKTANESSVSHAVTQGLRTREDLSLRSALDALLLEARSAHLSGQQGYRQLYDGIVKLIPSKEA